MLTDESRMPFGMHVGARMQDVPAAYLLHIWDLDDGLWRKVGQETHSGAVADYIKSRFHALETECTDLIIDHRP